MAQYKTALSSVAPIPFDELPSQEDLAPFVKDAFGHAELILNSIPALASSTSDSFAPKPANSAQSAEETSCKPEEVPIPSYERDAEASKAWGKPIKFSAKDNPLGVQVYKMAAHDRHGAWFARRSVHQGIGFEKWRKAASLEFVESLKVQEGPGSGSVRGVGADRRVEKLKGPQESTVEVWQTSSAFPGPVTPRGSLTLLISSTNALSEKSQGSHPSIPRHFLVISRPTKHADAPDRPNLVKMEYESMEMIREVPIEGNAEAESNPVEWLMVTRSDPGGGIPRFMVERGTPGSIVGDVTKFLNWATRKSEEDLDRDSKESDIDAVVEQNTKQVDAVEDKEIKEGEDGQPHAEALAKPARNDAQQDQQEGGGIVSKLTGAVESAAASYLPAFQNQSGVLTQENEDDSDTSSDITDSSGGTFRSALHEQRTSDLAKDHGSDVWNDSNASLDSSTNGHKRSQSKELNKLLAKRAALDEQARKDRDSFSQKAQQASEKEEKERTKMLEKHEKQRKKQEDRYQRELAKIDERRVKEEKKEEARRQKAEHKDAVVKLKQELQEWKSKCQVAEKEAELLRTQVESLQRENTAIIARLPDEEAKSLIAAKGKSKTDSIKAESTKSAKSGAS